MPLMRSLGRGRSAFLGAAMGIAAFAAGCGETTVSAPLPAGSIVVVSGQAQSGVAGQVLPEPITVRVLGTDGQPLPGVQVTFAASGTGSVSPAAATTDADGLAGTQWTLGRTTGANALTASAAADVTTAIAATAAAGPPATIAAVAGDNQTALAGTPVTTPPSVRVTDANGNPVEGAAVTFSILSGGGRVTDGLRRTSAQGVATAGSWVLGSTVGTQTLTARAEESGVANNPVLFTATATARIPAQMVATAGNNQRAPANQLVPIAPTVVVTDAFGQGLPGIVVTFSVTSGGGSVVGGRQVTDQSGTASVGGWFLGNVLGPNTLAASTPGVPSVTFTATAEAGTPAIVVAIAGDDQTAVQGTAVSVKPAVRVTDSRGNPVSGATVTFAVVLGGGSATGLSQVTDAAGIVTAVSWILGSGAPNTLRATVTGSGITGNPVTFTAQSATAIGISTAPAGPITLGTNFTITIQLRNALGASVAYAGAPLTIAIASGGGTLNGTLIQVTSGIGVAVFTVNVTGSAGARTFTVTGTGLLPATTASITFN